MSDLEWSFEVSGNAKEQLELVDQALQGMPQDLAAVEDAIKQMDRAFEAAKIAKIQDPMKQNRALLDLHRRALKDAAAAANVNAQATDELDAALKHIPADAKKAADALSDGAASTGSGSGIAGGIADGLGLKDFAAMGGAAGLAAKATEIAVDAVKELVSAVADATVEFVKLGVEQGRIERQNKAMLASFDGADVAAETLAHLKDVASDVGTDTQDVVDAYRELRSAGVDAARANEVLAASYDAAARIGGGPEAAKQLQDLFAKMKTLGKIEGEQLDQLRKSGVDLDSVYGALGKRMGITADEAHKALVSQKADIGDVQQAILDAIRAQNGGVELGSAAKTLALGDVDAQLARLQNRAIDLFAGVNTEPIAHAIGKISDALEGPFGDQLRKLVGGAFEWIGKQVEKIDFDKLAADAAHFIDEAGKAWDGMQKGLQPVLKSMDEVDKAVSAVDSALGEGGGFGDSSLWQAIGAAIGATAMAVVSLYEAARVLRAVIKAVGEDLKFVFYDLPKMISDRLGALVAEFFGFGKATSDGFKNGLMAGLPEVESASDEIAKAAQHTIAKRLDINSPSKVMQELGMWTGEGFKLGLEETEPTSALDFEVAAPDMTDVSTTTTTRAFGPIQVDVHVNGSDSPAETAKSVKTELLSILDELAAS